MLEYQVPKGHTKAGATHDGGGWDVARRAWRAICQPMTPTRRKGMLTIVSTPTENAAPQRVRCCGSAVCSIATLHMGQAQAGTAKAPIIAISNQQSATVSYTHLTLPTTPYV